jgi:hypothetical protein
VTGPHDRREGRHADVPLADCPRAVAHADKLQVAASHLALLERDVRELELETAQL